MLCETHPENNGLGNGKKRSCAEDFAGGCPDVIRDESISKVGQNGE
jgi:hypothetical protein